MCQYAVPLFFMAVDCDLTEEAGPWCNYPNMPWSLWAQFLECRCSEHRGFE